MVAEDKKKTKEKIEKAEQDAWDMIEKQRAEAKTRGSGSTSTGEASSSAASKPSKSKTA